ncbi:fluoride efflux transporter CrcB [Gordonia polyisoprenivorans]|uniref:fluoride efflux transporter CrcB n=1 Tax=Gordonia polyisoprenivorans TaxID=84595 RepID=UPI0023016819|nr:fluoride efflux transporter CrcB [Gordonia polyisoprenivorans]WCB35916.1 fluoride efflux transporter CrcB [Gordonia polyisoprenivorans]
MTVIAVLLAGSLGAVARFVVDGSIKRWRATTFPWATFVINVTGSLVLGILAGLVISHGAPSELQTIAGTGFCGGYTTFSTASVETVRLAEQRHGVLALANAVGSVIVSVVACAAGLALMWAI